MQAIQLRWFYSICIVFVVANSIAIAMGFPWVGLLPIVLIIAFLIIFKLNTLLLFLTFLIPISINISDVGFGLGISLPDEPFIIGITVLAGFKFIIDSEYDFKVFKHPITIAIFINLLWLLVTTFTSDYPIVSLKYFLSRFWFIVVFYFLGIMLFRKFSNIIKFFWLYMISLFGVVLYTLYKHSWVGFSLSKSYTIMQPFFIDHGVYAATISLFLPFLVFTALFHRRLGVNKSILFAVILFLIVFLAGIYFSYTRAAWIGILASIGVAIPLFFRIKFNTILIVAITMGLFAFVFQNQILYILSKNQQKSADGFANHFQSISNIKTDPSNTERINRWMCAISMFEEKPIVGFGPGTYSFCYAPFQQSKYLTEISTNFGDGGNSHSEYLNPLAESGVFGLLSYLLIIYMVINTGFRLYYTAEKFKVRIISISVVFALVTYFTHGFVNNYIESNKTASVLWACFGILTALDLYHNKQKAED